MSPDYLHIPFLSPIWFTVYRLLVLWSYYFDRHSY